MLEACDPATDLTASIKDLVERKRETTEADRTPQNAVIHEFLRRTLEDVAERVPVKSTRVRAERLDGAFLKTLRRVGELSSG